MKALFSGRFFIVKLMIAIMVIAIIIGE